MTEFEENERQPENWTLEEIKSLQSSVDEATKTLERIVADRGLMLHLKKPIRKRLLRAAGRLSSPTREESRRLQKTLRRAAKARRSKIDSALRKKTGIQEMRQQAVFSSPKPTPGLRAQAESARAENDAELNVAKKCYVCKTSYRKLHFYYDQLCPSCADFNWSRRTRTADLSGTQALLTGGRVKIGYQTGLKLLRAGASLIVTTRFPADAARRYQAEEDAEQWKGRLEIVGLDLRAIPAVEKLADQLISKLPRLDYVIHNACQTVRKPRQFYSHLLASESTARRAIHDGSGIRIARIESGNIPHDAPSLSQLPLLPEDSLFSRESFPLGRFDADEQQVDLRKQNSWRLRLGEVSTVEFLEVMLINATAPFVLNSRLRPLMKRTNNSAKHIVNVSAMEGQFYRGNKTDKHPHTNMAKAALNMMTRTAAQDYLRDGIHMTSVDTGWVTDEDPLHHAERKKQEHAFSPPLDIVDGAARIVDPIFSSELDEKHYSGVFLKDYHPTYW